MKISPKNLAFAMKRVGLDQPGPIHADDLRQRQSEAVRLAEFMDRLDQPIPDEIELPKLRKPFTL